MVLQALRSGGGTLDPEMDTTCAGGQSPANPGHLPLGCFMKEKKLFSIEATVYWGPF